MARPSIFTPEQLEEAKERNINLSTVRKRIERGMSVEQAIRAPLQQTALTKEDRQQAAENNIKMKTVYTRLELGWSVKEAVTIPANSHHTFSKEDLETAAQNGISYATLQNRFYRLGWELEECINTPKHGRYVRRDEVI